MGVVIDEDYLEQLKALDLPLKESKNQWLVLHMHGDGDRASSKFNIQVYENSEGRLTLVTNDQDTLDGLLEGREPVSLEGKRIIQIDDSGWGFPLGGVLCGAHDSEIDRTIVREVEVEYFQGERYQRKEYLDRFRDRALEIVSMLSPSIDSTVIKICTGYVNIEAKKALREQNFALVQVDEIGEPLQTKLEEQNRRYIKQLIGKDLYYDPKGMSRKEIAQRYQQAIEYAREHNLWHLVKTGWKSLQK